MLTRLSWARVQLPAARRNREGSLCLVRDCVEKEEVRIPGREDKSKPKPRQTDGEAFQLDFSFDFLYMGTSNDIVDGRKEGVCS